MSVSNPAYTIKRQSVVGHEGEWVKMFDPPTASPPTPELLSPTNPVPELMAAAGYQKTPTRAHTVQRELLHNIIVSTWDKQKELVFFVFADKDNPAAQHGTWPAPTIRVPRGVIYHAETNAMGPPPHTIHWHGIEPTPMNDGVGHCSMELGHYIYQWQPNFIGTYFYHCHRNTVQHFEFGLYGMLLVEPPDAYFATLQGSSIPIGACRDGKRRTAANLTNIEKPDGTLMANPFPGFNSSLLTAPDPLGQFPTDPHAMTIPYDVEALWVLDDRASKWSDEMPDARATFPVHGDQPGVNDKFHESAGVGGCFAFNQFDADYWFVTGVPVPAAKGGTGTIPADIVIPPELNSGVSGMQVPVNAEVGQTILIRCLDAAYNVIDVTLPVDSVIIAWDGRSLGIPPYGQYSHPYLVPANSNVHMSTARRCDFLIRTTAPINSYATVKFTDTRDQVPGVTQTVLMTARIPFNIALSISGKVTTSAGAPLKEIVVNLQGPVNKVMKTDASGNYRFSGLVDGSYTVTASLGDLSFAPSSIAVTLSGASASGKNFTASQAVGAYSISGSTMLRFGDPLAGVTVSLKGPVTASATTDAAGNYSFTSLPAGDYVVTPSLTNYRFSPQKRGVHISNASVTGAMFRGRKVQ